MARSQATKKLTRIQREKTKLILDSALDVFSDFGFRGSTIDMIATQAGLSKPNILYYFDSKEAIHSALLAKLLETWLEPLKQINRDNDPIEEVCNYVNLKLEMARDFPRESKLFANEILQGAPHIKTELQGPLKSLVDAKSNIILDWATEGRIASVDPKHLFFSIWATTQHYADFDIQVRCVLGDKTDERFAEAKVFLNKMYRATLTPKSP